MDLLEKIPRQHAVVDSLFPMGVFINLGKTALKRTPPFGSDELTLGFSRQAD